MLKFVITNKIYGVVSFLLIPLLLAGCPQQSNCSDQDSGDSNQCQAPVSSNKGDGSESAKRISVPFGIGFVMPTTMAVQPDGKILYAGGTGGPSSKPVLVRYKSNGKIDPSFGSQGVVIADFGNNAYFYGVAVQGDGKIIATGASYNFESLVMRFKSDGSLDSSFSAINISGNNSQGIYYPSIQADGKIIALVGGSIIRVNSDGSMDNSFVPMSRTNFYMKSMALQSDQKIVACGNSRYWQNIEWGDDFTTVVRLNSDGSLDSTFGNAGEVSPMVFGAKPCDVIAVQPDGKILIGGNFWYANTGYSNTLDPKLVYVIRLNVDGSLDSTFASGGTFVYSMPKVNYSLGLSSILVLSNGHIFVAGSGGTFKLNPNGTVNSNYVSPILADSQNGVPSAAISPSGDIIMSWQWSENGYIYQIKQ